MNDKYLNLVEEFTDIYLSKPIKNNQGGMGFNHSFALFCILRENNPSLVVESGVFKGQSTFIIENSLPNTQIISLDVNFDNLEYRSKNAEYINTDFNSVNWSKYNTRDSVCFFDDHQNSLERLKEMKWWGFKKGIFEDIESPFIATRYHSLIVDSISLPSCLEVTAYLEDLTIMGLRHKKYTHINGVQFHPESVLTQFGHELIRNFLKLAERM